MLTLETVNSRPKTCQRCGSLFRVAYSTNLEIQTQLMELHLTNQMIKFARLLRQVTNCKLTNAKGTYLHYVSEVGKCHWCKSKIKVAEFVDCPKCKSLNIYPFASDTIS